MAMTTKRRAVALGCATAVTAMMLAGCLQNPNAAGRGGTGEGGTVVDNAETDGDKVVTVMGAFGGEEANAFRESLKEFEAESGITVEFNPDSDFTNTIRLRTSSGQQPDIAIFPQPGGLLELGRQGYIEPIDSYLDYDELERTLIPGFLESARLNGRVYGAPMRMAVKSLVWYPKPAYEAGGWNTAPANLDELAATSAEISASGTPAWCMGWESGPGTGWPGTDWIEELMLRMWGPEVYDDWTSHRIPFNDERVIAAFDALGEMIDAPDNVRGGRQGILSTAFADAMLPAFNDPPGCFLERQGNFVTGFFPADIQANLDEEVGVFVYPPAADGEYTGQPMLGGGDLAALMNGDDPDAIAVMKFITSPEFGGPWASTGGWLSPHKNFDLSLYPDELTRKSAEFATSADVFRYDGSDLMPNAVGAGSFWDGMVEWLQGTKTAEQVTTDIENSWPVDDTMANDPEVAEEVEGES